MSVEEARRQIDEIKRVGQSIREAGLDTDDGGAGIEIDRTNGFAVRARFAGTRSTSVQRLEARGISTRQVRRSRGHYLTEIRRLARLLNIKSQNFAVVYDELENTATLLIRGRASSFPRIPALPVGVNIEFQDELITTTANVYGSDPISEGGTVGFVSVRGGVQGVTAAGHIHSRDSFFTVNGGRQTIRVNAYNAQNDMVWGNNPSSAYGPWIRVTSSGGWKSVSSVGTIHAATPYCKYGRTTGVTCGIYSRTYTGPWQSFSSGTFPLIQGNVQMARDGDSGGPVFEDRGSSVAATGTVIGFTGGGRELVVYPVQRFASQGVSIVTQP